MVVEDQQEKRTIVLNYNDFLILFIFSIYEGCISTNVMKPQLGPHSKLTNQNLCGFLPVCVSSAISAFRLRRYFWHF